MKLPKSSPLQAVLGVVYMAAGVGVFVMLPRRMAQIGEATQRESGSLDMVFIWLCFGLIGALLFGGGIKKIIAWYRSKTDA